MLTKAPLPIFVMSVMRILARMCESLKDYSNTANPLAFAPTPSSISLSDQSLHEHHLGWRVSPSGPDCPALHLC